jgi:hypothetical protein
MSQRNQPYFCAHSIAIVRRWREAGKTCIPGCCLSALWAIALTHAHFCNVGVAGSYSIPLTQRQCPGAR